MGAIRRLTAVMSAHAVPVTLSAPERKILERRARGAKTPYRDRVRALIVLGAARGHPNARIAADLGISQDKARRWRGRFAAGGLEGLKDLPRAGRPRRISELDRAAAVALACQLPAVTGVPLARWTGPELLAEITPELSGPVSLTSLRRILAGQPVKPWQYRSWIYPRDPGFEAKARVILDLYQGFYQGKRLRPGDQVLSFDAKPQIQARERRHATLPAAPTAALRVPRPALDPPRHRHPARAGAYPLGTRLPAANQSDWISHNRLKYSRNSATGCCDLA